MLPEKRMFGQHLGNIIFRFLFLQGTRLSAQINTRHLHNLYPRSRIKSSLLVFALHFKLTDSELNCKIWGISTKEKPLNPSGLSGFFFVKKRRNSQRVFEVKNATVAI
jgi:hypothetical protein